MIVLILPHLKHPYRMSPMMPLSLLSSVEVGEVTEAWLEGTCLTMLLSSPPAGGCSVEHGDVLLLARLDEGEILWKRKSLMPLMSSFKDLHLFIILYWYFYVSTVCKNIHFHFVCNLSFHSPVFRILRSDWQKMHFVANFCNNFHHYLIYRLDLERLFHVKQRLKKHKLLHSYPLYI